MNMDKFGKVMSDSLNKLTKELARWRENAQQLEISSYRTWLSSNFRISVKFKGSAEEWRITEEKED